MAYHCTGRVLQASIEDAKKICSELKGSLSDKLDELEHKLDTETSSTEQIELIIANMQTIRMQIQTAISTVSTVSQKVESLEQSCPTTDLTSTELTAMYNGA